MQYTHREYLSEYKDKLKKYFLNVIAAACVNPNFRLDGNVLHFGNLNIRYDQETDKVLIARESTTDLVDFKDKSLWIEIDNENYYPQLDDIAGFADTCEDYIKCREAGNSKYSLAWNIPPKNN